MPHVQYWARVRAGMDCPLRRGAWYRVVELTPGETVLEVNSRLLRVHPALPTMRRSVRDRVVGLTLACLRSAAGRAGGRRPGARAGGRPARAGGGVQPPTVKWTPSF